MNGAAIRGRYLSVVTWSVLAALVMLALARSSGAAHSAFPGTNGLIVYAEPQPEQGYRLYLVRPDGTGTKLLMRDGGLRPQWSPDGKHLLVEIAGSAYVVDARPNARLRLVAHQEFAVSWSRDGSRVVFLGKPGKVFSVNSDGSGLRVLLRLPSWTWLTSGWRLSPQGDRFVFDRTSNGGTTQVWVLNADGTHLRRITSGRPRHENPAWSPDGRSIVYAECPSAQAPDAPRLIVTARLDGSRRKVIRRLVYSQDICPTFLTWSPDGTKIAYADIDGITIGNADTGGGSRKLGRWFTYRSGFDWQAIR